MSWKGRGSVDQQKTGAFICGMRKERGLTQRELAEQLNVTDKAVSKWERGLSYPDITILSDLARALGVTERELLTGARESAAGAECPAPERVVQDTLEYAQKAEKQRRFRAASVVMAIYTAALAVAVFVCALCDGMLSGGFTWSLIVLVSCLLGWGVGFSFLCLKRRRVFWAAAAATVLTPLLLWTIQAVIPDSALWYPAPAMPILGVALAWVWVPTLLHSFTRMSKWFVGAAAAILGAPLNILINGLSSNLPIPLIYPDYWIPKNDAIQAVGNVSSCAALLALGVLFLWLGRRSGKKHKMSLEQGAEALLGEAWDHGNDAAL